MTLLQNTALENVVVKLTKRWIGQNPVTRAVKGDLLVFPTLSLDN